MIKFIRKLFIPKNTPYCHHNFKKSKKYAMYAFEDVQSYFQRKEFAGVKDE